MTRMNNQTDTFRRRLIGAVHVAANRRGIDDELRKDIQREITGKDSCAKMTVRELGLVLDNLNGKTNIGKQPSPIKSKVTALWLSLYNLGVVKDPSSKALDSWIRNHQKAGAGLRMLTDGQCALVVEALKDWCTRDGGVTWIKTQDDRSCILNAQFHILADLHIVPIGDQFHDWLKVHFNLKSHWCAITDKHRDHIIRKLGEMIRDAS